MNEHNENDKLRVLLLKPGEQAEIAEIEDNLRTKQIREGLPTDPDDRKHTANNSVFPGDLFCQYRQLALHPSELPPWRGTRLCEMGRP